MPRILYIDDDEGLRRLTRRALARRGYELTTAGSADEGLALLQKDRFDLVAIDHYMPGKTGLDALPLINALPSPPPVVYVTGSEESSIAVAALKAGARDYVVKTVGEEFFDLLASSFATTLEHQRLVAAQHEAEHALKASNERLTALLREANHRVANSLQIVSSFIQMQANAVEAEEAKIALKDTQQRVYAIGQVHRRLYTSQDINSVEMGDYLSALTAGLEETWSSETAARRVHLTTDGLRLTTDQAVSLGVVVNELVSNACKYAYGEEEDGDIRVDLTTLPGGFRLSVEDDGKGFNGAAAPTGTGLGTKLVTAMARSLNAEISYEGGPPTRILLVKTA
ncbi:histidine kinase dimerization/phosphoacceptor domain -containing protein [Afifella marina]|uniref:histidine kinase n=1 Tax=Afifella marina DSM 2698 TaxID=1120955 RepID=A0A1G5P3U3_AFIMA|nr:histidine kinase dimerization/phosphoacceptor domain -containing protein [Afifella marina]MBK1625092.1 two-component system sensor histidine kinase/response regulator [Afifella marina DSM 2698]MBK1628796.1 two-component system sensor histidine kinase/response regulator [Afifella marina]MBK5918454.1 two-component system sensor histidine kinase/response regulator [Afifella marina]RAI19490.1 two-component system sensor histidine kinase/response regulator [Afifella marina DSM 2698]SCZ44216.1 Tw